MEPAQVELLAPLELGALADRRDLPVADEVGRELRRGETGAAPFAGRLRFLLEALLDHELHRLILAHAPHMDSGVQYRVDDGPEIELLALEPEPRVLVPVPLL